MRSNAFSEARKSLFIFALILIGCILFYLVASMFTSMGYKAYHTSSTPYDNSKYITIVVDPGHGGEDPGAFSDLNLLEKDINLDIASKLNDYLVSFGYNSILTRTEDKLLYSDNVKGTKKRQDLENRVEIANKINADCFISIHMNKYPAEYCRGLQTFYSNNSDASAILAEYIQKSSTVLQTYNNRKIKDGTDTIFVLENLKIPAVLIECGFLSNNYEATEFSNEEYRSKMAFSIFCGISNFWEMQNET